MDWTPEADQLLIKLWDAGGNIADIVLALQAAGHEVTRNAVVGRKYRLPRGTLRRIVRPPPQTRKASIYKKPAPKGRAVADAGVDYFKNDNGCRALLDHRSGRWNLPMVCGEPREPEGSYCAVHARLYMNPAAPVNYRGGHLYYNRRVAHG